MVGLPSAPGASPSALKQKEHLIVEIEIGNTFYDRAGRVFDVELHHGMVAVSLAVLLGAPNQGSVPLRILAAHTVMDHDNPTL